jgi:hypothetical protein
VAKFQNILETVGNTPVVRINRLAPQCGTPGTCALRGSKVKNGTMAFERISTQTVFDVLEVPHRSRTAGACRRLSKLMRELGWSPIKARGLTPGGFRDQVRGYARDMTRQTVM